LFGTQETTSGFMWTIFPKDIQSVDGAKKLKRISEGKAASAIISGWPCDQILVCVHATGMHTSLNFGTH
jgi:hypothetical protein